MTHYYLPLFPRPDAPCDETSSAGNAAAGVCQVGFKSRLFVAPGFVSLNPVVSIPFVIVLLL